MQTTPPRLTMTEAEIAQAALKEVGAPTGRIEGQDLVTFTFGDIKTTSPAVFWRALCLSRMSMGRRTEPFDAWRERQKADPGHQKLLSYRAFCIWLDSVDVV